LKEPTEPAKDASVIISDCKGSARREKSESEVKTRAVSRVAPLWLLREMTENTAKVRIGAATGVMYATQSQYNPQELLVMIRTESHVPY
jgi:hypothetical protein